MISNFYNILKHHFYSPLLLISILCAVVMLYVKYYTALSPLPDISGSERSTTIPIALVASGLSLFTNPEASPFFLTQYAPLYLYSIGLVYKFLGFDPTDAYMIQLASRIGSALFVFIALAVNYATLTRRLLVNRKVSLVAVIFLFGLLQHWHLTNSRVDSLLYLCTSVFLYYMFKGIQENTLWNSSFLFAVLASTAAVFTKQSALIHCVVLVTYFLLNGNWKAVRMAVVLYSVISIVLISIFSSFDYFSFLIHFFGSLNSPLMFSWFYDYTYTKLIPFALPLIVPAFIISIKWSQNHGNSIPFFMALATGGFFLFALGTSFKYGAGVGYFHEFALIVTFGILYYFFFLDKQKNAFSTWLIPAMFVSYSIFFATSQIEKYKSTNFYEYSVEYNIQKKVKEYMQSNLSPNDKLLIIPGQQQAGNLLEMMLLEHIVAYQDDVIHFNNKNKSFDYTEFYKMATNDGLKFIITKNPDHDFYLNALDLKLDKSRYTLINEIEGYYIYQTINSTKS